MGGYFHDRVKYQLVTGIGLVIRFIIVSDFLEGCLC
jgi:hypothetical protein